MNPLPRSELDIKIVERLLCIPWVDEAVSKWRNERAARFHRFLEGAPGFDYAADDSSPFVDGPIFDAWRDDPVLEAIIRTTGRPTLLVQNDSYDTSKVEPAWRDKLEQAKSTLVPAILSVGRVEAEHVPGSTWLGTAFVVGKDLVATNRHVASYLFSRKNMGGIPRIYKGRAAASALDFKREINLAPQANAIFQVVDAPHIAADAEPDLAILRVNWRDVAPRVPLQLSEALHVDQEIAVIGHPTADGRTKIPGVQRVVFAGELGVKRLSPGQIMEIGIKGGTQFSHDCSTLGGNSGSAVFDLASGKVLGVHFGGTEGTSNYAVPSSILKAALAKV